MAASMESTRKELAGRPMYEIVEHIYYMIALRCWVHRFHMVHSACSCTCQCRGAFVIVLDSQL